MNTDNYLQLSQMESGAPSSPKPPQPQQNVPHGTFNPLEKGASEAIRAVRETIGSKPDRRRPFVEGLAAFANAMPNSRHIQQMPNVHPYAHQDQQMAENMQIMQYLQKVELAKQQQQEVMNRNQEQARHHRAIESHYAQRHGMEQPGRQTFIDIDGKSVDVSGYAPIEGKTELNRLQKQKNSLGTVLHSTKDALRLLDKLEKTTEGDVITPGSPGGMGAISRTYTNVRAGMGNKHAISERDQSRVLNDKITSVRSTFENAIRNGVVPASMANRFEKEEVFPRFGEPFSTTREKLKAIEKDLSTIRKASEISLRTRRNIDPLDLENLTGGAMPAPDTMSTEQIEAELANE